MNSPCKLLQPACLEQVSAACTASVTQCTVSVTQAHTLQDEFLFQTVTTGMPRASFASLLCLGHLMSHAYLDL